MEFTNRIKILVHVLDCFQTQLLLRHRAVSHRFLGLTIRIIHSRLLRAALLEDRKLILECYHPSAQYTEPYLYCDYLGTPGLSDFIAGDGRIYHIAEDPGSGGTLRKLYSHFRPTRKDPEPYIFRSHPAGDTPGSRTNEAANLRSLSREADVVTQQVNLEAHELFSQLCFSADLVQVGPRRGVFLSNVNIVDRKYTRIWRHWLAERAKNERANDTDGKRTLPKGLDESLEKNGSSAQSVLWVDQSKIAGLRLRVKERRWRRDTPILMRQDEDEAVSYILELEGQ